MEAEEREEPRAVEMAAEERGMAGWAEGQAEGQEAEAAEEAKEEAETEAETVAATAAETEDAAEAEGKAEADLEEAKAAPMEEAETEGAEAGREEEECTAQSRQQRAGCDPSAWRGCCSRRRWHRCTRPQDGRRSEPPGWLPRRSTWSGRSGCRQACPQRWR